MTDIKFNAFRLKNEPVVSADESEARLVAERDVLSLRNQNKKGVRALPRVPFHDECPSSVVDLENLLPNLMQWVLDADFAGGEHLEHSKDSFSYFTGTHWSALSDAELGGRIINHLPAGCGKRSNMRATVREVIDLLKMQRATSKSTVHLDEPLPVINVANGELWVASNGTIELRAHDPASRQNYCIDVAYDPNAACPIYDRAMTEIFSSSTDTNGLISLWHEFSGYVIQPSRPDARIFVGWGAGNDGKSALAGLLVELLGRDRVAALPVGKLASNPFMLGHLADKALILDDDVAAGTVLPDGLLKTISEGKIVTGERKHRDPFEFPIRTAALLLCNAPPHLHDNSYGFRRRLITIPFARSFTTDESDRTLFQRIKATEMPGVLNRALEGLQRVTRRGWRFDPPEAVTRATDKWWVEATGLSSELSEEAHRAARGVKQSHSTTAPAIKGRKSQNIENVIASVSLDPATSISVDVALPAGGKACAAKVRVRVGPASVEVCVTGTAQTTSSKLWLQR